MPLPSLGGPNREVSWGSLALPQVKSISHPSQANHSLRCFVSLAPLLHRPVLVCRRSHSSSVPRTPISVIYTKRLCSSSTCAMGNRQSFEEGLEEIRDGTFASPTLDLTVRVRVIACVALVRSQPSYQPLRLNEPERNDWLRRSAPSERGPRQQHDDHEAQSSGSYQPRSNPPRPTILTSARICRLVWS